MGHGPSCLGGLVLLHLAQSAVHFDSRGGTLLATSTFGTESSEDIVRMANQCTATHVPERETKKSFYWTRWRKAILGGSQLHPSINCDGLPLVEARRSDGEKMTPNNTAVLKRRKFIPVKPGDCPVNPDLPECNLAMAPGQFCEADGPLPDGFPTWSIDNCAMTWKKEGHAHDVFKALEEPLVEEYQFLPATCPSQHLPICNNTVKHGDLCRSAERANSTHWNCGEYVVYNTSEFYFEPVKRWDCPQSPETLPDCQSDNLQNGSLCEADAMNTALFVGNEFQIDNCNGYDVFTVLKANDPGYLLYMIEQRMCPSGDLPECTAEAPMGDICEADRPLPDGNSDFQIDNCGVFDVFHRVMIDRVGKQSISLSNSDGLACYDEWQKGTGMEENSSCEEYEVRFCCLKVADYPYLMDALIIVSALCMLMICLNVLWKYSKSFKAYHEAAPERRSIRLSKRQVKDFEKVRRYLTKEYKWGLFPPYILDLILEFAGEKERWIRQEILDDAILVKASESGKLTEIELIVHDE